MRGMSVKDIDDALTSIGITRDDVPHMDDIVVDREVDVVRIISSGPANWETTPRTLMDEYKTENYVVWVFILP